jgi:hypothetical protein
VELRAIYLQHNGELPASLFGLRNLVRVDLAGNTFTGEIPPDFNKLVRLGGRPWWRCRGCNCSARRGGEGDGEVRWVGEVEVLQADGGGPTFGLEDLLRASAEVGNRVTVKVASVRPGTVRKGINSLMTAVK